jgi:hypothetical protein
MVRSYELGLETLAAELDEWRCAQDRRRRIPEGSVLSPLFGNIYLRYVLDLWFLNIQL